MPLRHVPSDPRGDPRRSRHAGQRAPHLRRSIAPEEIEDRTLTEEELVDPVHPYVRIHSDGTVVAYSSQIEMGQGIHTGLATIVAEELDAEFESRPGRQRRERAGSERRRLRKP